jgi:hypothetical protein
MKTRKALMENSLKRRALARELRADADAARQRSNQHRQSADAAKVTMERLRDATTRLLRYGSPLEMAERHVAEAERHVERQRELLDGVIRAKHERLLEHAQRVLEVLERSRILAHTHLALEREFRRK